MHMLSDFDLTASRLAELLVLPVDAHAAQLAEWLEADRRPKKWRDYYRLTRAAVEDLHLQKCTVRDLRLRVDEWRLEAEADAEAARMLGNNIRATTQYLDEHGEREMVVLPVQQLETVVGRVRVTAKPHMFVHAASMCLRLWIDCSESLRELVLIEKCRVTLWLAHLMKVPDAQVEVVHSATRRIVARSTLPPDFDRHATAVCETVHRVWSALGYTREVYRRDQGTARR